MWAMAPTSHVQKAAAAARGKATEEAPSWRGTSAVAKPKNSGTNPQRISVVRYRLNIWNSSLAWPTMLKPPSMSARSMPSNTPRTRATPDKSRENIT